MDYKPEAMIIDLDGTLADIGPARHYVRSRPKNFDAFHTYGTTEAKPNPAVTFIMGGLTGCCYEFDFLFVTGRMEKWRTATKRWLNKATGLGGWGGGYNLFMRADDDYRDDVVVKNEIYVNEIRDNYYVQLALDDKPEIVALWRSLGIPTLQVPGWYDEDPSL